MSGFVSRSTIGRMPFKIHKTPAGDAVGRARLLAGGAQGRPVVNRQRVFDDAKKDGETLSEAAAELGAPDYVPGGPPKESAGIRAEGEDEMQAPVFPETVPWPPAEKPSLPFKVK